MDADAGRTTAGEVDEPMQAAGAGARPWGGVGIWLLRAAGGMVVVAAVGLSVVQGLELRQWLWEWTQPIRFEADINNGFQQGLAVVLDARRELPPEQREVRPVPLGAFLTAYLNRYERVEEGDRQRGWRLDYPPARLLVMSLWVRHIRGEVDPDAARWREHYTAPLLRFNAMLEMVGAIGMFVLVYYWSGRGRATPSPGALEVPSTSSRAEPPKAAQSRDPGHAGYFRRPKIPSLRDAARRSGQDDMLDSDTRDSSQGSWDWRGVWRRHRRWILALLAAGLLWFNPAMLWNAHAWPQWDSWIVPFYIWAAVLASVGWWFGAGLLVAAGCMLKGQLLLAAPVLVMWPLFSGRPGAAGRVLLGLGVGVVVIASPWLMREAAAWAWLGSVIGSAGLVVLFLRQRTSGKCQWLSLNRKRIAATALLLVVLVLPWVMQKELKWVMLMALGTVMVAAHPMILRRMKMRHVVAGVVLIGAILAAVRFDGSMAWYRIGFAQGTEQYPRMAMGQVNNLATIMEKHGWRLEDTMSLGWTGLTWLGLPAEASVQKVLRGVYGVLLVLCGVGLAMQSRRGSARVLVALAAPWVVLFAVLPQMHERYLLWAAAVSAAGVAVGWRLGVGMLLMHLVVTGIALGQMAEAMLTHDRTFAPQWLEFLQRSRPDLGWVVLFAAGVYLYVSLVPPLKSGSTKARIKCNEPDVVDAVAR